MSIFCFIIGFLLIRVAFRKKKVSTNQQNFSGLMPDTTTSSNVNVSLNTVSDQPNLTICTMPMPDKPTPFIHSDQYMEHDENISHPGDSSITDEEVPYLVRLGYAKFVCAQKESSNPKFHRTEREEDLSFNFAKKHEHELAILINQFEELYRAAYKTDDLSQQIELLNRALIAFKTAKKFAYSKGKGGTIYFQDMYECMHNSRNSCFSYADLIQDNLDSAIQERDVIIPGILQIICDNDCILQKNIYAKLPAFPKSDIQRIIRKLEAENKIIRIKKSSSYELHIVK